MELATNTFTKGLQMDTNPMILGSESLTDCLNGTLITMNGNEVILQNDMGNRRVDNAFLPSGYLPVGMKEYGGIIYVAAYNPITDKSQIGSFPSPERRIDTSTFEEIPFEFCLFFSNSYIENEKKYLKSDSFLIPLTKDVNLHAGDKFAIYSNGLSLMRDLLTNYDNILPNNTVLARSPKNRRFTILVGVLNSQNEFVDITKTLCRWTENGTQIEHDSSCSDIYKFNHGYFISDLFLSDFVDTIEDSKLIRKRLKMAANTYSYKLVGPLYLKISLNHILNFNYNIYGLYDKDKGEATLWVEGFLTYNCPDNATSILERGNSEYYNFDEGIPSFEGFICESLSNGLELTENNEYEDGKGSSIYDSASNTYSVKIVKEYNISNIKPDNTVLKYGIYIPCDTSGYKDCDDISNIYLRGLSEESEIDLSLLGSGKVFIKGWRFYNNVSKDPNADSLGNTTLTYSINAYPKYGEKFINLRFKFVNIVDDSDILLYPRESGLDLYNGRNTVNINWEKDYFQPRTAYKVFAYYDIIDSDGNIKEYDIEIGNKEEDTKIWFLTTELFNEFYSPSKGIENFCTVNIVNPENSVEEEFAKKLLVDLKGNSKILDLTLLLDTIYEGSLVSRKPMEVNEGDPHLKLANIKYKSTVPYNVKFLTESYFSIFNEELYPKYIKVDETNKDKISISEVKCKVNGYDEECEANTENVGLYNINDYVKRIADKITGRNTIEVSGGGNSDFDIQPLFEQTLGILLKSSIGLLTVEGTAKCNNYYYGYNDQPITEVYNAFDRLSNILLDEFNKRKSGKCYGGVVINYDLKDGGVGDRHYVDIAGMYEYDNIKTLPRNDDIPDGWTRIYDEHSDNIHNVRFKTLLDDIYSSFNTIIYPSQMFIYLFPPGTKDNGEYGQNTNFLTNNNISVDIRTSLHDGKLFARVWWRTKDGEWALFKNPLEKVFYDEDNPDKPYNTEKNSNNGDYHPNLSFNGFKEFIINLLRCDYIYCMYEYYSLNNSNYKLYTANNEDYKYYNYYSFPITYIFNYKLYSDDNIQYSSDLIIKFNGIKLNELYGNLIFKAGNISLNPSEITLEMSSSKDFFDRILNFNPNYISNIELSTGLMYDSNNIALDPNYVYTFDENALNYLNNTQTNSFGNFGGENTGERNGGGYGGSRSEEGVSGPSGSSTGGSSGTFGRRAPKQNNSELSDEVIEEDILYKITDKYLYVDRYNKIDDKNTLVYNRYSPNTPKYRFDGVIANEDSRTYLDYGGANIIDGV